MNYKNGIIFTVGILVGGAISWAALKQNYENRIQEEVASIKEAFSKKESAVAEIKKEKFIEEKPDITEYVRMAKEHNYVDYSNTKTTEQEEVAMKKPYIISPEEFGDEETYNQISLTYYADGVLTDGDDVITDVDDIIGSESLDRFGEYEEDSIHVRNERLKTDFEVLLDHNNFADIYQGGPHYTEV